MRKVTSVDFSVTFDELNKTEMPKRDRQFDEPSEQPMKKHVSFKNDTLKVRNITSTASERTINLLFEGASKCKDRVETPSKCTCLKQNQSSNCYYCNKIVCPNCVRLCDICNEDFCANCSLLMHDLNCDTVCLSCLKDI